MRFFTLLNMTKWGSGTCGSPSAGRYRHRRHLTVSRLLLVLIELVSEGLSRCKRVGSSESFEHASYCEMVVDVDMSAPTWDEPILHRSNRDANTSSPFLQLLVTCTDSKMFRSKNLRRRLGMQRLRPMDQSGQTRSHCRL